MNTKQLTYFLSLAKTKSIAATAKRLDIAQPSVSQQIKNLEHEMGVILFERSFRGVQLTRSGEKFMGYAESIISHYNEAKNELSAPHKSLTGRYRIGMLESIGNVLSVDLIEEVQRFVNIELVLTTVPSFQIQNMLLQGQLDIALSYGNEKARQDFICHPLIDENMFLVLCNSQAENSSEVDTIPFWRLSQYDLLTPDKDSSFGKILKDYEQKTGVALHRKGAYSGQLLTGLRQVIQSDKGMILPSSAIYHLEPLQQLRSLKIVQPEMTRTVVAYVNRDQHRSVAVKAIVNLIKDIVVRQNTKKYWRGSLLFKQR